MEKMENLFMKENMRMEEEMDKEHSILVQEKSMRENSEMEREKEKVHSTGMTLVNGKEHLLIMKWMEMELSLMEKIVGLQNMKRDN